WSVMMDLRTRCPLLVLLAGELHGLRLRAPGVAAHQDLLALGVGRDALDPEAVAAHPARGVLGPRRRDRGPDDDPLTAAGGVEGGVRLRGLDGGDVFWVE